MPLQAPTAAELLANTIVVQAIEQAWIDSQPADPLLRHDEGGWIFMDTATGQISVQRQSPGVAAAIDLGSPPVLSGSVVVAKFHTHPDPTSEGWLPGPSEDDEIVGALHDVPDLIRADGGFHVSGPDNRRGGLAGGPGYPP
ncbi:MAG: hypothetical protein FJ303_15010 [Planctomycetes bacterium]|nr:hypothetical protein [Planctomycetota bacterium]